MDALEETVVGELEELLVEVGVRGDALELEGREQREVESVKDGDVMRIDAGTDREVEMLLSGGDEGEEI